MQWLPSHVRRYHNHYGTSGHVWQGRFKSFPVQRDEHLITVLRYVLQNPVRAGLSSTPRQKRGQAGFDHKGRCWRDKLLRAGNRE
jgi:putative transposase